MTRPRPATLRLRVELLSSKGATQAMVFALEIGADTLLGYWALVDAAEGVDPLEPADPQVFGVARAERGPGELVRLRLSARVPCRVLCDVRYRCSGAGPGACNASNTCLDACDEQERRPPPARSPPADAPDRTLTARFSSPAVIASHKSLIPCAGATDGAATRSHVGTQAKTTRRHPA